MLLIINFPIVLVRTRLRSPRPEKATRLRRTNIPQSRKCNCRLHTTVAKPGRYRRKDAKIGFAWKAVINNAGTIHGDDLAIALLSSTSKTITNTGTISGPRGIMFVGAAPPSVENGGIISATANAITPAGNAITFGTGSSNILTLDPGSSITGNVVGAGTDRFQLGGTGAVRA